MELLSFRVGFQVMRRVKTVDEVGQGCGPPGQAKAGIVRIVCGIRQRELIGMEWLWAYG